MGLSPLSSLQFHHQQTEDGSICLAVQISELTHIANGAHVRKSQGIQSMLSFAYVFFILFYLYCFAHFSVGNFFSAKDSYSNSKPPAPLRLVQVKAS